MFIVYFTLFELSRLKGIVFMSFRLYKIQIIVLLCLAILLKRVRGWVVNFNKLDGTGTNQLTVLLGEQLQLQILMYRQRIYLLIWMLNSNQICLSFCQFLFFLNKIPLIFCSKKKKKKRKKKKRITLACFTCKV